MSSQTKCPICQKEFIIKNHLKSGVSAELSYIKYAFRNIALPWIDGLEGLYKPNLVVCPKCGNEFNSIGFKYFGFIKPSHLQIGLVAFVLFFILSFLVSLIWSALKI
jgi:hypothetical protein